MAPFMGFGLQGALPIRGELFWANETQARFRARESDGEEMLGVTDKDPIEKVWYEVDFIDILHGATISALLIGSFGSVTALSTEIVDGHLARVLVSGVGLNETALLRFDIDCSDGSHRKRSLKIRGREL